MAWWRLSLTSSPDGPDAAATTTSGRIGMTAVEGSKAVVDAMGGDQCVLSSFEQHICRTIGADEGSSSTGSPGQTQCERIRRVLRNCVGRAPEVIEESREVTTTGDAHPSEGSSFFSSSSSFSNAIGYESGPPSSFFSAWDSLFPVPAAPDPLSPYASPSVPPPFRRFWSPAWDPWEGMGSGPMPLPRDGSAGDALGGRVTSGRDLETEFRSLLADLVGGWIRGDIQSYKDGKNQHPTDLSPAPTSSMEPHDGRGGYKPYAQRFEDA